MSEVKTSPLLGTDANGDPTYTFTSAHTFGDVARWIASEGGAEDVAFMLSEAALTRANAATAAAYEVAAEIADIAEHDAQERDWRSGANQADVIAKRIRALATPDQTAALDKLIAEAEARGMERAAIIANKLLVRTKFGSDTLIEVVYSDFVGAAILAASKKGGV